MSTRTESTTSGSNTSTFIFAMVGLPGSGKTTLAKELAANYRAIRFTPDEWMLPLYGEPEADAKRDILEGRLISIARQALRCRTSVVLDFGLWSRQERSAIRAFAVEMGATFRLVYLPVKPDERQLRLNQREKTNPEATFQISDDDLTRFTELFEAPTAAEIEQTEAEEPPKGHRTWQDWMLHRWPTSA